jgi:hypothetical protein
LLRLGAGLWTAEFLHDYRRKQILRADRTVMAARGFARMSIGAVVKAAGLSRGTFYGVETRWWHRGR